MNTKKFHIKYAIIIAAILCVCKLFIKLSNTYFEDWTNATYFLVTVSLFCGVVIFYSKKQMIETNFQLLFSAGFKTTAAATCIIFIFSLLFIYVLFPNFIVEVLMHKIAEIKKANPTATYNESTVATDISKKVIGYTFLVGNIMGTMALGIIGSVLGAIISLQTKK